MRYVPEFVEFHDGSRLKYAPPTNTLDPRYVACRDHRVACDCREALLAENIAEYRVEAEAARKAIREVLAGHDPDTCGCTGCDIAKRLHLDHLTLLGAVRVEEVPF